MSVNWMFNITGFGPSNVTPTEFMSDLRKAIANGELTLVDGGESVIPTEFCNWAVRKYHLKQSQVPKWMHHYVDEWNANVDIL